MWFTDVYALTSPKRLEIFLLYEQKFWKRMSSGERGDLQEQWKEVEPKNPFTLPEEVKKNKSTCLLYI